MSEDERKADKFGKTFKDEADDPELFENLRRTEVGRAMQNRPWTGNATSSERHLICSILDVVYGIKKMRYSEMNPNESSCQPLDLSLRGASNKTDGIRDGEISSSQKTQSSTSASATKCSCSAFSSSDNSREKGKKHVCDDCKKRISFLVQTKDSRAHSHRSETVCVQHLPKGI
ncbi:hypothetical protein CEXT_100741 [Caerostris extrusa]|uniref:Uncharacterized protein n=1 Tax=Caerostris extrusa TaxID=172846 RepID=A0AAV4S993_CAEEX|nr:hypothetical protein CEXT_100741 [Caerostris extrusa]